MSEIEFLEMISTLVWNDISKQELVEMLKDRKEVLKDELDTYEKRLLKSWDNGYTQGYDDGEVGRKKHKDLNIY